VGQNSDINTGSEVYEHVEKFTYLGTTLTNQSPFKRNIKHIKLLAMI
jgi:hypothetical protein